MHLFMKSNFNQAFQKDIYDNGMALKELVNVFPAAYIDG